MIKQTVDCTLSLDSIENLLMAVEEAAKGTDVQAPYSVKEYLRLRSELETLKSKFQEYKDISNVQYLFDLEDVKHLLKAVRSLVLDPDNTHVSTRLAYQDLERDMIYLACSLNQTCLEIVEPAITY